MFNVKKGQNQITAMFPLPFAGEGQGEGANRKAPHCLLRWVFAISHELLIRTLY